MRISAIEKLKNFGIYRDFSWNYSIVAPFKKYNLVFGWNRCGKTTLSRVFTAVEKKSTLFKQYPKNGEFEIKIDDGSKIKNNTLNDSDINIKVFNRDFIEENISFDPTSPCNPIVYISEEDIDSSNKLKGLKEGLIAISEQYNTDKNNTGVHSQTEEKFRKSVAQTVKSTAGNMAIRDKYYDYDKNSATSALKKGKENLEILNEIDFEKYKRLVHATDTPQQLQLLAAKRLNNKINNNEVTTVAELQQVVINLLNSNPTTKSIERLKNNTQINTWVKEGFDLHKQLSSEGECLFCQNQITPEYFAELANHYNNEYEQMQEQLSKVTKELQSLKIAEIITEREDIYPELKILFNDNAKKLNSLITTFNDWLDTLLSNIKVKQDNPLSPIDIALINADADYITEMNSYIEVLNKLLEKHNERARNHSSEVAKAKELLENHIILTAMEEQNYEQILEDLKNAQSKEEESRKKYNSTLNEISELEKKVSSIGVAVDQINQHLNDFFGRQELKLELANDKKGYLIKRDSDVAQNLSEGEKSAIAFSYFIVKTRENGTNIANTIIVIDDPISSFDSNYIYHCFSLIKNYFSDAAQLIISTHNFELFNLLNEWMFKMNKNKEEVDEKCNFYMIENTVVNNVRFAEINMLDETLRKFKSEYHYLFSRLTQFISNNTPEYADFYIIGNIARRFLEIYTSFKIPNTGDLYSKLLQLKTTTVTDVDKDKVYKLIQEFSHGTDFISGVEHKDKSEIQEAVKALLKLVEESDPIHYKSLEKSIAI